MTGILEIIILWIILSTLVSPLLGKLLAFNRRVYEREQYAFQDQTLPRIR